jgi:methylglutamate dehydrogenase subunit D
VSSGSRAVLTPGRSGKAAGAPGLVVRECLGLRAASVIARRGQAQALVAAVSAAFGVVPPTLPVAISGRGATFVWAGPEQWLVEAPDGVADIEAWLAPALGSLASVSDQSDSRVVIEVSGPRVRDVLAKGVPIDLHPSCFCTGDVAVTVVGHVGVQIRQVSDAPSYRLAVVHSYFGSFWHWLELSAAEFGCEVAAPLSGASG